ncbi:MAG: hypothetical protein OEY09_05795 [Gammaproteobacteria bacterium]|nr:hypothetical protein [Gammaproteobacteria bacterium]
MFLKPLLLFILILSLTSCTLAPQENRYERVALPAKESTGPVAELHRKAMSALAQDNSKEAIDLLQRAIKIQPRNPYSWHYLALSYWQAEEYGKCLAMVDRSRSYSAALDDIEKLNQSLKAQCGKRMLNG